MPSIIQQSQLITVLRAATEAERGIQEWISSHAGPNQNQVKRAVTAPGLDITHIGGNLSISVARAEQQEQTNQCSIYAIQYNNPGIKGLAYAAYALIIFPQDSAGPGAISITIHEPHDWGTVTPPWGNNRKQPAEGISEIFNKAREQELRHYRRMRRTRHGEERLETLQRARETYGPVLFITPKGIREEAFSRLL